MKKSILALSITLALFSCKKKETTTDFTATDVTGTSVVKGNVNKNVITPNGVGAWTNTSRINMAGVVVTIKVNKGGAQGLYPNSTANGADVYSGTTDANGNYAISVKSNATGVSALITIDGFTGTQDTIINSVVKTGLYATYFGTSTTRTLFMGQNTTFDHNFTATNVSSNPNNITIGTAQLSGSISMNMALTTKTGTNPIINIPTGTNVAVPAGITVYMSLDKDPTTLVAKLYTATTDAAGRYSFTFPTVAASTPGFFQNATIWVADHAANRDTLRIVNGSNAPTTAGPSGVFNNSSTNQGGLFNNENRNATNFSFGGFTAN
ncbi:MAG: hypothetical protein Q7W45_04015 [Bacteroidota bacterium]|nr:hypothetical protein [Bacteroidota bacterium]MDP3144612.1 hypothetical protein [Bacteroidota bacterium]MDP3556551.1 hypothetical protein [Bacteroidota bacterium]